MRILVCGLPGTGKSTFAANLLNRLGPNACWFNADDVRKMDSDWDFSYAGRMRQAYRMRKLADESKFKYVICDFVAPTEEIRTQFKADFTIWMDTETSSDYKDTDQLFESPSKANYIIKSKDVQNTLGPCVERILQLG